MQDVIIIGAGPAGMALSKCLKDQGIHAVMLEREATMGSSWRRHYDRLHLHTARGRSHLPGLKMPRDWPQYVPRAQVVSYLDAYAKKFDLTARCGIEVHTVTRVADHWQVTHSGGTETARHVVLATGFAQQPRYGNWPGLGDFPGPVLHTRGYRRPADLPGARVLVVGFGNSGGEIAIDLVNDGRQVDVAVRSPVNLLPKQLLGVPIGNFDLAQRLFGPKVADALTAPILRMVIGDYAQYGLRKASLGPQQDVIENGRVPLIDIGTLALLRDGRLRARPGVQSLHGAEVQFTDGSRAPYDAILMATGYRVDLRPMLGDAPDILDGTGRPKQSGAELCPGLWAISYHAVTNGQLQGIARQAPVIARGIARGIAQAR